MKSDYKLYNVRSAAILTNSYVAGTVIDNPAEVSENNILKLDIAFTIGSLTDARIKVEYSDDNITYYQDTSGSVAAGIDTVSPLEYKLAATENVDITIYPIKTRYIRISAKGTGVVTSSSLSINATLGTV